MCLTRRQNGHSCTGKHWHYYYLLLLSPSRHAAAAAAAPALSPLTCVSWHGYGVCHRGTIRQPFPESAQRAGGPITGIRGGGGSKAADDSGKPGRLCWRSNKAGRAAKRKAASTGNRQHVLSSPAIRRPGVIPDFSQPLPAAKPLSLSLSPLLSHLHKHWHRFSSGQRQDRTGQKAQLREPGSGLKAAKATRKHIPQADDRQWSAIHPSYAGPAVHRRKKKTAQHNTQTHSTNVYKNGR